MRAAPGGLCCFHSRLSGHWEGFGPSPPLKELLRKHLMGAGVQRGAGSVPTPRPLYPCQGESFSGHEGKALGGSQPSTARSPVCRQGLAASPPPPFPSSPRPLSSSPGNAFAPCWRRCFSSGHVMGFPCKSQHRERR